MKKKIKKQLYDYPLRKCMSLHSCCVCEKDIKLGEYYFDGGINKRCHENCAPPKF